MRRDLVDDPLSPLIMGVDIARQGSDQTVIRFRRGLDARSIPAVKLRIPDLMLIAGRVIELVAEHRPDAVFVDGTGIGCGVRRPPEPAGLRQRSSASISAAAPTATMAHARAMPTSAPRCGAS